MQHRVDVEADVDATLHALGRVLPSAAGELAAHRRAEMYDAELPTEDSTLAVSVTAAGGAGSAGSAGSTVTFDSRARVEIPIFAGLFIPLIRLAQRRRLAHLAASLQAALEGAPIPPPPKAVPGLPPVPFSREQSTMLSTAGAAAAIAGFGAALFGQQADFVADSFGTSDASLGVSLAVTRFGIVVSLVATSLADRRGRRLLLLVCVTGVAVSNLVSAMAPELTSFTVAQTITRGFVNSAFAVAGVTALEEAPEGARGFSAAMIAMAGGLGFSIAVCTLPISDLGTEAWRLAFVVSGLSALLVPRLARLLPESRRYLDIAATGIDRGQFREILGGSMRRRLVLLAVLAYMGNLFAAPSAQLMNRYLSDERGFSGAGIVLFRATTTALPGLIGLIVAMRLVEARGRRPVGGVGIFLGNAIQIVFFLASGVLLWLSSAGSLLFSSAGGIALGALSAELFPTEVRATSNALLTLVAVLGSASGLAAAGLLSDPFGSLGVAIAVLGVPSLLALPLVVPRLPEPAGRELDEVSPPALPPGV